MQVKFTSSFPATSLIASPKAADSIAWRFWAKWLLAVFAVFLIFLINIEVAPFLHGDEFMIVDLGRIILHPETEWSITWLTNRDEPVFAWFYVGPVLQELTFQIMGQYGPRISGLIGAIVAATAIVGWLMARGSSQSIAFVMGIVFLLDPLFVQAYSMGRVDGWTIALCITSCLVLRTAIHKLSHGRSFKRHVILAGALAVLAFFTWPSAVFLFPLILLELFCLVIKCKAVNDSWQKSITPVVLFGVGGFITALLLLLPIASHVYAQFSNLVEGLKTNTRSGPTWGEQSGYLRTIAPFIELLRALKFSPVLVLIALAGAISKRQVGVILAGLVATSLMLFTLVYIHRVLYLLPYFIVSVAGLFQNEWRFKQRITDIVKCAGIALLLIWPITLSLFIRSNLALDKRAERERELLFQAAHSMIGSGSHSVFAPYEFYYSGRILGWKMYKPYLAVGEPLSPEKWLPILPYVDFMIVHQEGMTEEAILRLNEEGLREHGSYSIYDGISEKDDGIPTNIERLRNLYSIYRKPYGPYKLYVREGNPTAAIKSH